MSLAALHGCTAAKHRFKDRRHRRHGKKIYNSITLESETCGAAEQAPIVLQLLVEKNKFESLTWLKLPLYYESLGDFQLGIIM